MSFFTLLPPEINSGLIYAGPGSGSLTAAATAWNGLGEDLSHTGNSVSSVVSGLQGSYQGPSAQAMTGAVTPYTTWLYDASVLAQRMGTQAATQAGLYETAHAAVIPPPVIAANRAQLLMLIATNFFGQNAAAIAANEAQYQGYWATDAAAMDSYWTATQANTESLAKPIPPPPVANDAGQAHAAAAQAIANTATSNPTAGSSNWLTNLWNNLVSHAGSSSGATTPGSELGGLGPGSSSTNSLLQSLYYPLMYGSMPLRYLMMLTSLFRGMGSAGAMGSLAGQAGAAGAASAPTALMNQIGEFVDGKMKNAVGTLVGHFNTATHEISAKLGQAASMGSLRVPQGWSQAAEGMLRAAPVLPHTTVSAPVQTMSATSGLPGGPFGHAMMGAMAGRGLGSVAAKAPKIVPRSPAGG